MIVINATWYIKQAAGEIKQTVENCLKKKTNFEKNVKLEEEWVNDWSKV